MIWSSSRRSRSRRPAANSSSISAIRDDDDFERKFRDPNGIIFDINWKGWSMTAGKVKAKSAAALQEGRQEDRKAPQGRQEGQDEQEEIAPIVRGDERPDVKPVRTRYHRPSPGVSRGPASPQNGGRSKFRYPSARRRAGVAWDHLVAPSCRTRPRRQRSIPGPSKRHVRGTTGLAKSTNRDARAWASSPGGDPPPGTPAYGRFQPTNKSRTAAPLLQGLPPLPRSQPGNLP